jgi:hypothetical protein
MSFRISGVGFVSRGCFDVEWGRLPPGSWRKGDWGCVLFGGILSLLNLVDYPGQDLLELRNRTRFLVVRNWGAGALGLKYRSRI